jgi:hypothetical protein
LLKPNGATAENKAEYEDDEEDDEVDVDEDEDDEDDEEYVEEEPEEDYSAHPNPLNKKRSIDEVVDKDSEASEGSKKIKA